MCDLVLFLPGLTMVEPALFFISLTLMGGSQFSGRCSLCERCNESYFWHGPVWANVGSQESGKVMQALSDARLFTERAKSTGKYVANIRF